VVKRLLVVNLEISPYRQMERHLPIYENAYVERERLVSLYTCLPLYKRGMTLYMVPR
jgi:hypothetical protein